MLYRRNIYEIDIIKEDGELVGRYFAATKKAVAGVVHRQATMKNCKAYVHEVCRAEWSWIDESEVE